MASLMTLVAGMPARRIVHISVYAKSLQISSTPIIRSAGQPAACRGMQPFNTSRQLIRWNSNTAGQAAQKAEAGASSGSSAAAGKSAAGPGKPAGPTAAVNNPQKIIRTLLHYVWPAGHTHLKIRVLVAMGLLVGSKIINIQVPFLFKRAADHLAEVTGHGGGGAAGVREAAGAAAGSGGAGSGAGGAASSAAGGVNAAPFSSAVDGNDGSADKQDRKAGMLDVMLGMPFAILIGYGIARSTAAGFAELRNTIFSSVAQRAIRLVSRDVFRHLLNLDMKFHLNRQTGALQRVMDRGSRSINFVLTSLVFNVVPTALEIGLVCGIFATQCGWQYAATTLATLTTYVYYTGA